MNYKAQQDSQYNGEKSSLVIWGVYAVDLSR